jgi:hypothetical protein
MIPALRYLIFATGVHGKPLVPFRPAHAPSTQKTKPNDSGKTKLKNPIPKIFVPPNLWVGA